MREWVETACVSEMWTKLFLMGKIEYWVTSYVQSHQLFILGQRLQDNWKNKMALEAAHSNHWGDFARNNTFVSAVFKLTTGVFCIRRQLATCTACWGSPFSIYTRYSRAGRFEESCPTSHNSVRRNADFNNQDEDHHISYIFRIYNYWR